MKQFLCRLLALIMVISMPAPAFAAGPGAEPADTVKLMYLNPSKFQVREDKYKFTNADDNDKLETMAETAQVEDGNLKTLPDAPEITGWTFAGWYTEPVSYAFWGDTPKTAYNNYEGIPFNYDCDGRSYKDQLAPDGEKDLNGADQWTQRLESYWIWLSALGDGKEPVSGKQVKAGDPVPDGVTALYARYVPTEIEYKLYYQGWNGTDGVLHCVRQYGTPFGRLEMDGWDGYAFEGWYTEPTGGDRIDDFYDIPGDGSGYYAHWHNSDGTVTHENYKASGYDPVTSLSLRDGDVGKGLKDLGDTLELPHGQGFKSVTVVVTPVGSGVTDLEWELRDDDSYVIGNDTVFGNNIVTVEMKNAGSKLEALVRAAGGIGKTTLTVRTKDGKISDSVVIDTTGHLFNKVEVTQWGSCSKPKILLYTCGICGKTKQEKSYADHQWAWRDIPGTCTTDHVWEQYCKVCGAADPDESTRYWVRSKAPGHQFETTITSGCGGTVTTQTCTVCGYTESTVGEGVHNWDSAPTVDVRPTCHSDGSRSVKCLDCGAVKPGSSEKIPRDASLHTWEPWVVNKEATETEPGEQTRTCSSCHTEETRAIPPTGIKDDPYKIANDVETSVVYIADKVTDQVVDQDGAAETIRKTIKNLLGSENRDMLADDIYFASLQSQDISATIQVTPVAAPEEGDDFSSLLGSGVTVVYMDIDIFVKVGDQNLGKITQTSGEITFKAELPGEGDIVRVLRAHEGAVDEIPCRVENGSVYFSTSKFSTFAVAVGNKESNPGDTPGDTPSGTPGGTPSDTPSGTPGDTPSGTPGGTPGDTPSGIPGSNPGDTPGGTPGNTPGDTPSGTPGGTPGDTPSGTPGGTPGSTPSGTPGGTPGDTPSGTPGSTPGSNPGSTPSGTPGSTPSVNPGDSSGHAEQVHVCPAERYMDVVRSAWYHDGVDYVVEHGLMTGKAEGVFDPGGITTRAEIVTILYRLDGEPTVTKDVKFDDVPAGQWYSDAISWAAANEIVGGYGDGRFGPDDTVTREQMAAILYRYAGCKGYDMTKLADLTGYTDANTVSGWAVTAMRWAVTEGIINGTSTTTLSPAGDSTRAQVATIFMRFCENIEK